MRPPGARANFTDVSAVPKYVMSESDYEIRTDSVLAWKKAQKLGRFNPDALGTGKKREQALQQDIDEKGLQHCPFIFPFPFLFLLETAS